MGNTAYLCCSNLERTHPSFRNSRYRAEVHTLAGARACVPLLWLALFRPEDLRTDVLMSEEGEDLGECAPLARRVDALARFDNAVSRLEKAYPRIGPLNAHAEPFRRMLKTSRGKFVTIELEEVAWLSRSRTAFDKRIRKALSYIAGRKVARVSRTLTAISGVDPKRRLVPPKELFARSRPTKADLFACMNIVGTSFIRAVPWEDVPTVARKPARRRAPKLHQQLHAALDAGDEARARELLRQGADPNVIGYLTRLTTMDFVTMGKVSFDLGRALVAAGFDLTKRRGGYTTLQWAIWGDRADVVAQMLELGASPTQKDCARRTPLTLAAYAGALKCIELLLPIVGDDNAIRTAIRKAEKRLTDPPIPGPSKQEQARIRKAILRLQAAGSSVARNGLL